MQSDPIGLIGGVNTYSYVLQNPLIYVDLLGLQHAPLPKEINDRYVDIQRFFEELGRELEESASDCKNCFIAAACRIALLKSAKKKF